jgi:hypothetical protein
MAISRSTYKTTQVLPSVPRVPSIMALLFFVGYQIAKAIQQFKKN